MRRSANYRSQGEGRGRDTWLTAVAYVVSIFVGAGGWLMLKVDTSNRESWDNPQYFLILVPVVALTAFALGFAVPHRYWRWGIIPYLSQAIVWIVQNSVGNVMPLGLILLVIMAGANVLPPYVGSLIKRYTTSQRAQNESIAR